MGRADALKERRLTHGLPTLSGREVVEIVKDFLHHADVSKVAEF